MAKEPSWEDIFNPEPTPEPASRDRESGVSPREEYPPTRALPTTDPAAVAPAAAPVSPSDPFADLFPNSTPPVSPAAAPVGTPAPQSRREARANEGYRRGGPGGGSGSGGGETFVYNTAKPKKKRRLLWLKITLPILILVGGVGGAAAYAWFNYNEQVREILGIPLPTDYESTGNGVEAVVTVRSGDIGSDVARTLHDAGVTMTFDAVYDYLVANPDIGFTPGNWSLQQQMSAESAVAALQDPANKLTDKLLLREGIVLPTALEVISETTGIPLEEVQSAAADVASYGLPAEATTLEGFLFPATYELDGSESARDILQMLVNETISRLDAAGVAPENRWNIIIMASVIQREAGANPDDFYKVSRVFTNRLEQGINLQSDATVAYGTGRLDTVWTESSERADASNLYNTYANPGLPIGPIGLPGDLAIAAAVAPADGPWLFFVPVNLATGETVFSETADEHQAAVDRLLAWCEESTENASYCA
jgi:UPF0755 protein